LPEQEAQTLILELDGSMIAIVEYSQPSSGQQKQERSSQVITEPEELCKHHPGEKSPLVLATQYLKNWGDRVQYDQAIA